MQSGKKETEFKPRTVAVKNLYAENVRLQKLCAAHRKQIRGMQKTVEFLKAQVMLAQASDQFHAFMDSQREILEETRTAFVAPTKTEVENAARN